MAQKAWGRYTEDPPITDVWYFREHEIALIARALGHYAASLDHFSNEREQAMTIWRRLTRQEIPE